MAMAEIWFEISAPPAPPISNSAMMSTLSVENETVRERNNYAEAKKMKLLTLNS